MQQIFKGMDNGASTIDANFTELVNANLPTNSKTVQNLTANGVIDGKQKVYTASRYRADLNAGFNATRVGSLVKINIYSNGGNVNGNLIAGNGTIFGDVTYNVPAGFRPTTIEAGHFVGDSQNGSVVVWQDGGVSVNKSFINQSTYWSVRGSIIYYTADAFPTA